jgi:hypothetical protein
MMARKVGIRSTLASLFALLAFCAADRAVAQAVDLSIGTGNTLPQILDTEGIRHHCLFGYSGSVDPPMPAYGDRIIVCRDGQNYPYVLRTDAK